MSTAIPVEQLGAGLSAASVSQTRSLRSNFSWTMAGNVVYGISQWGILALLAKQGSPEDVGVFSLGLAITAPIMLFASLQLRAVQATDARRGVPFADYAGTRTLTTGAAALLICIIGVAGYRGSTAATIAALALSKGIESLSDIVYGFCQLQERMDLVAQSLMLRGTLSLGLATLCFLHWHTVWAAVCGTAAAWAGVFAAFDMRCAGRLSGGLQRSIRPRFHGPAIRRLLRISLPLGMVAVLLSLSANVPRYMVSNIQGVHALGIFSALSYVLLAGGTVVNALGQSATPRLAHYWAEGRRREFRKLVVRLLSLGLLLGAVGILVAAVAGHTILRVLYGAEYANSGSLLVWLMIAAALNYLTSFAGYSLTAARYFRCQLPLFGSITALMAASCRWLVKVNGALGAAQAMTAVGAVQLVAILAILSLRGAGEHRRAS